MTVSVENPYLPAGYKAQLEVAMNAHNADHAQLSAYKQVQDDMHSFIATPRSDPTLWERIKGIFKDGLKPGIHIAKSSEDSKRYMFLITSNSYEDRENETITSAALKAYEASCYLGDGLFHCDNPLLWWHDDDVIMGEIVAVNYSEPFLIEIAKEAPTLTAKVLWDYAERNGDKAGVSHRFGYRDKDRTPEGDYLHIFKQESTYLPERGLAANIGTYAGVIGTMATEQSDKRLNQIFEQVTGVKDAAAKIHAKSGDLEKELAALGINHKAAKPPMAGAEIADVVEDVAEDKAAMPAEFMAKLESLMQIYQLVMQMAGDQAVLYDGTAALAKELKASQEQAVKAKDYQTSLEQRIAILEKRFELAPRSVTQDKGTTPEAIKAAVEVAEQARIRGEVTVDPFWGEMKPLPKG